MVTLLNTLMGRLHVANAAIVKETFEVAMLRNLACVLIARRDVGDDSIRPKREAEQWKSLRRRLQWAEAGRGNDLMDALLKVIEEQKRWQQEGQLFNVEDEVRFQATSAPKIVGDKESQAGLCKNRCADALWTRYAATIRSNGRCTVQTVGVRKIPRGAAGVRSGDDRSQKWCI